MNILQVSTSDIGGGAEKEARALFQSCRDRGHASWLAVGRKQSADSDVFVIPNQSPETIWSRTSRQLEKYEDKVRGTWRVRSWLHRSAQLRSELEQHLGLENFNFRGTKHLLELVPHRPDIVHAHNLHGGYFDLRALTKISQQVPVVLTLHDEWMLTGHCAYSLGCKRWQDGCGKCPDLSIYPSIERDATAWNWKRKRRILQKSQLWISTPSRWLMNRVDRSGLIAQEKRVVPYGVDQKIFQLGDRSVARKNARLPHDAHVLLCVANLGKNNPFKDHKTIEQAAEFIKLNRWDRQVFLLVLGGNESTEEAGALTVRHVPYESDPSVVANYYQAADVFLHAAHTDNFPCTILESLACGTPVIATAVGGIPEQVKALQSAKGEQQDAELGVFGTDEATGFLVPAGDGRAMAMYIEQLLRDPGLRARLSENAERDARRRFSRKRQVDDYLSWYEELIEKRHEVNMFTGLRNNVLSDLRPKKPKSEPVCSIQQ